MLVWVSSLSSARNPGCADFVAFFAEEVVYNIAHVAPLSSREMEWAPPRIVIAPVKGALLWMRSMCEGLSIHRA